MANMFDPNAKRENTDYGIPPGDYVIALTHFERKEGKTSGKPYLRSKYTVVLGNAKDKTFWASISLDTSNGGSMTRLSLMAECCGVTQAFDLDSDSDFERNMCFRPFKARVTKKTENGYTNNDIARYLKNDMSAAELKAAQAWALDQGEANEFDGGGSSGGSTGFNDDFGDDEIPFATCEGDDAMMRLHDPCAKALVW